jgi:hypothetical protein
MAKRTISVCYIAGPPWRKDIGLVIGFGPICHPWGAGETGEVNASATLRLAVAVVDAPKACTHEAVSRRAWMMTKNRQRVKRSPVEWRLPEPDVEDHNG